MSDTAIPTIVLFGTTGSGKSSVINMLPNDPDSPCEEATVKSSLKGVTANIQPYRKRLEGKTYCVLDTIGTGEGLNGTVPTHKAIEKLYDYLLSETTGVHLIAIVMKGGRITKTEESNYLFARLLFGDAVPVVLIVTHLENEADRAKWWDEQDKGALSPAKAVGIVSSKGGKGRLEAEYEDSKKELATFIRTSTISGPGCKLQPRDWFRTFFERLGDLMRLGSSHFYDEMYKSLINYEIEVVAAVRLAGKIRPKDPYPVVVLFGQPTVDRTPIINRLVDAPDSSNFRHYTERPSSGSLAGVQEFRKVIGHLRIRILDIPGVDHCTTRSPSSPSSSSSQIASGQAIKALFNAVIGQPLGVNCVVLVVVGPVHTLSVADANHYNLMRYICGPKLPISLISILPTGSGTGGNRGDAPSPPKRLGAYSFEHHVQIPLTLPRTTTGDSQPANHPERIRLQDTLVSILKSSSRTKVAAHQHQVNRLVSSVDEIRSASSGEFQKRLQEMMEKPKNEREGGLDTTSGSGSLFGRVLHSILGSWW